MTTLDPGTPQVTHHHPHDASCDDLPDHLKELVDVPLETPGLATRSMDGRLVPLVFATVTDGSGTPRGGVLVELLDADGEVADQTRTSPGGLAVLRFPPRQQPGGGHHPAPGATRPATEAVAATEATPATGATAATEATAATGTAEAQDATAAPHPTHGTAAPHPTHGTAAPDAAAPPKTTPIRETGGHAHGDGDPLALPLTRGTVRVTEPGREPYEDQVEVPAGRHHAVKKLQLAKLDESGTVLPGEEQLSRLPTDFSTATCAELTGGRTGGLLGTAGLPARPDPLLPAAPVGQLSLTGRRTPLVRRLDVVRRTRDDRRWLVQLRQEWVLLGYTLGELADVTPLDPGSVLQEADQVVDQVTTATRDAVDTVRSTVTQTLVDALTSYGSVDTVVRATASVSGGAGGAVIGIPGLFAAGGVGGFLNTSSTVSTGIDTSLLVNRSLQQVSTLVNQAIAHAEAVAQGVQRTAATVVNHLAPVVSRVTNALHWRVYENYAVCTHVDGVLAIEEHAIQSTDTFRFTASWARALRAFLEPALLDRALAANFTHLAAAAETPGTTGGSIEIRYNLNGVVPGVSGEATAQVTLSDGTRTWRRRIRLPGGNNQVVRELLPLGTIPPGTRVTGSVVFDAPFFLRLNVDRVALWVDNPLTGPADQISDRPGTSVTIDVRTEGSPLAPSGDALLEHLNANRAYYLDVIAAAAARFPALRVDAARAGGPLAGIPAAVWRLPIVGFEGNKVLVARRLRTGEMPAHAELLERDPGSGTLVQLLAPGAYGEVLQGVSALTDLANNLHPALKAVAPSQFVPFPVQPVLPPAPLEPVTNGATAAAANGTGGATRGTGTNGTNGATGGTAGALTGALGGAGGLGG